MGIKRTDLEEANIIRRYTNGESATQIAKSKGVFTTSITRVLKRNRITVGYKKGKEHPNWKGGRVLKNGYPAIWNPTHHRANNVGYVKEHILIMEKELGRKTRKIEHIHHINFNRKDNKIDNLWICTQSNHIKAERSVNLLVGELINKGKIKFNKEKGVYEL